MRDRQTRCGGGQPRRCLHHGHVDRVRALRAAKDSGPEPPLAANRVRHTPPASEKLRPHRIARDERLAAEEREALVVGHRRRASTNRASRRLVSPGIAFCSISSVGMPRSARQRHHRARAVAAHANHDRRPAPRRSRATHRARSSGSSARPRASDASDFPFSPALRISSSANPSRGMTRASMPAAVPTNVTVASGTARSARAPPRSPDTDARPFRRPQSARDRLTHRTSRTPSALRAARCSAARPCRAG